MSDRAISDDPTLDELTARIREVFPRLEFSTAELIGTGDDNLVVVLDGERIARFPRKAEYHGRFAAELNLLSRLAPVSPLRVPLYESVSPDRSVGIYQRIEGRQMTRDVFWTMTPADHKGVLSALASFLSVLHALPAETIAQPDGSVARTWSGAQFAALYRDVRRPVIARVVSKRTLERFDAFHLAFESVELGPARLAHNDLSDDHILVDGTKVAGIIDFSDAAYGDPAIDFAWFWRLGEANVDALLGDYRFASDDPLLKARSHWVFVRYMINHFWYSADGTLSLSTEQWLAELEPHLKKLGL